MKILHSEKGVSAVEFALLAPFLFVLTFGIIEFGILFFDKAVITNASREGARAAIVFGQNSTDETYSPPSEEEIRDVVEKYTQKYLVNLGDPDGQGLAEDDVDVTYSSDGISFEAYSPGEIDPHTGYTQVVVSYRYRFLVFSSLVRLLAPGSSWDDGIDLQGRTIMRVE